ncbi:GNAT family N-acetyltransferase [Streptomyces sp. NBC_01803]|uniref:GNAT family N-acetyltransferase n=1 Tax=Streptomyces sp. NBC_01803 TaxID=2975946 RepID=UPI002DD907B1|nr:GNAT family N-acetyltransferase [Streptomyces sp. NBC_01803]WSA46330.1 GNAT family N-acetyltransferase [Streptomyces sp. NBC_01803]
MAVRTAVVPLPEIRDLRWSVLRPGLPRETAEFAEDGRPGTLHLAAYEDDGPEVLACLTLFPDPLPAGLRSADETRSGGEARSGGGERVAYRFRGMASAPAVRGKGYGAAVLAGAARQAAERGAGVLWCNGRTVARGFYERHGFAVVGGEFVIEGVGPHVVFVGDVDTIGSITDSGEIP